MQLISMRDANPKEVEFAISVLDKKRLRVSLRIMMIMMHFTLSAFIFLIATSYQPQIAVWLRLIFVVISAFVV